MNYKESSDEEYSEEYSGRKKFNIPKENNTKNNKKRAPKSSF